MKKTYTILLISLCIISFSLGRVTLLKHLTKKFNGNENMARKYIKDMSDAIRSCLLSNMTVKLKDVGRWRIK